MPPNRKIVSREEDQRLFDELTTYWYIIDHYQTDGEWAALVAVRTTGETTLRKNATRMGPMEKLIIKSLD